MLAHFFAVALSFPSVVYTVLLGISVMYWLFVMLGAAHIDALGDGVADGIADASHAHGGHFDGLDAGHIGHVGHSGVAHAGAGHAGVAHVDVGHHGAGHAEAGHVEAGHVEAGHVEAGHAEAGHAEAGHAEAGHIEAGHADVHHGALSGIVAALKLRSAPATVVLSVLVLFSWLFSVLGMQAAVAALPDAGMMVRLAVFVLAPIAALPFTSLAVRPLARVFVAPVAAGKRDLVGKVATVRTGTVTDRFGEAFLEDGGPGVVVRVRVDTGETLKRGAQVVITSYDAERQEFTVAPMDNLLDDDRVASEAFAAESDADADVDADARRGRAARR